MAKNFRLTRNAYLELQAIREQLGELPAEERGDVVLDLAEITLLDSMIVGQLVRVYQACSSAGRKVVLDNLHPHARQVLHHSNLDGIFGLEVKRPPTFESDITIF